MARASLPRRARPARQPSSPDTPALSDDSPAPRQRDTEGGACPNICKGRRSSAVAWSDANANTYPPSSPPCSWLVRARGGLARRLLDRDRAQEHNLVDRRSRHDGDDESPDDDPPAADELHDDEHDDDDGPPADDGDRARQLAEVHHLPSGRGGDAPRGAGPALTLPGQHGPAGRRTVASGWARRRRAAGRLRDHDPRTRHPGCHRRHRLDGPEAAERHLVLGPGEPRGRPLALQLADRARGRRRRSWRRSTAGSR